MDKFISLREFLLLTEYPGTSHEQDHTARVRAEAFVEWYELARRSFAQHGVDGPPVGSNVICLLAGHGGAAGAVRRFDGVCASDERFFLLSRHDEYCGRRQTSLVTRDQWWREICPHTPDNEFTVEDIHAWGRTRGFRIDEE